MADATTPVTTVWSPFKNMATKELTSATKTESREPKSELDKEAFLQLLITQMQYQDPLNPMDDQAFLGQMAQFSALEQMVNLNTTYSKTQAYSMMGKEVDGVFTDPVTGETEDVTGEVTAVTTKGSEVYLTVDGKELPMSTVSEVRDDYLTDIQLDAIYEKVANSTSQQLIGKNIQALLMDGEGNVIDYVEGVVDYVKLIGAQSVLMVNGKEVLPQEVVTIDDEAILVGKTIQNGTITGISIEAGAAMVSFAKDGATTKQKIDKINYLMEAMGLVGEPIEHNAIKGTVSDVTVVGGLPYMVVKTAGEGGAAEDKLVAYTEYIKE